MSFTVNDQMNADSDAMVDRRVLPGALAGVAGLVFALTAIPTHNRAVLVLAALFTVLSMVLVLTAPDVPLRYRDRRRQRLQRLKDEEQNAVMAARAARFEAEAIAAREQLSRASVAEGSTDGSERPWTFGDDPRSTVRAHMAAYPPDPDEQGLPGEGVVDGEEDDNPPPPRLDPRDAALVHDQDSGLFNQAFFEASLEKRISAARRGLRPLTYALVEVRCHLGQPTERQADPGPVADILVATLREADTVARSEDGLFALLLEDTPENGAVWTLERIRRRINDELDHATMQAGVSCYPAHAFDADQMTRQVHQAMDAAREWHQDRIEVTASNPDD